MDEGGQRIEWVREDRTGFGRASNMNAMSCRVIM
jgi:hypothetical protein